MPSAAQGYTLSHSESWIRTSQWSLVFIRCLSFVVPFMNVMRLIASYNHAQIGTGVTASVGDEEREARSHQVSRAESGGEEEGALAGVASPNLHPVPFCSVMSDAQRPDPL